VAAPLLAGAEPFSAHGGPAGVLVLHGFTGSPASMRGVAEALAAAGLAVELPLLPGHGTSVADMIPTRFDDWSAAAEQALHELSERARPVCAVGLSMGGTLAAWLAEHHPELAGLVLINPLIEGPDEAFRRALADLIDQGSEVAPGIGSDIAKPGVTELAYDETPLVAALSLFDAADTVAKNLPAIRCPVLLLSSRQDHVVPPDSGDRLVASAAGPVERVWLERSYHVATMDYDADEVARRSVAFVRQATAPGSGRSTR
jgi:carboxylesterase